MAQNTENLQSFLTNSLRTEIDPFPVPRTLIPPTRQTFRKIVTGALVWNEKAANINELFTVQFESIGESKQ